MVSLDVFVTDRNEVVAKVIFLHLFVIHSVYRGGGGIPQGTEAEPPHPPDTTHHPPPPEQTPPPGPGRLRHTVYERPVRILLECILVSDVISPCLSSDLIDSPHEVKTHLAIIRFCQTRKCLWKGEGGGVPGCRPSMDVFVSEEISPGKMSFHLTSWTNEDTWQTCLQ